MSESGSPEYLIEKPQDVFTALNKFWTVPDQGKSTIMNLLPFLAQARNIILTNGQMQIQWDIFYVGIGKTAMNHLGPFDQEKFAEFLLGKHRRYGIQPLLKWAHVGIVHRIDSKLERFAHLQTNPVMPGEPDDEDQIMDILGYCVLGFYLDLYFKILVQHARGKIQIVKNMPQIIPPTGKEGVN